MGIAREGTVEALIRGVRTGPSGPGVAALFDLDRTLIDGYSAISFFNHRSVRAGWRPGRSPLRSPPLPPSGWAGSGSPPFSPRRRAAARGLPEVALRELGEEVFERQLAARIFPEARRLVEAHRQRGHFLAIVTSATRYQVEPIARHLGIEFVACSGLEVRNGLFTGRVRHPVCYGPGKLDAARRFAARHGFELARASFYSDSHEDLPLLEAVGDPHPVNPTRELAETAAARRWPIHVFAPPPGPMRRWLDDLDARWLSSGRRSARPEAA
jgi:putative phosphoserine phosphatase/1-acylglycerol-3-phosphate O-acyltransferase